MKYRRLVEMHKPKVHFIHGLPSGIIRLNRTFILAASHMVRFISSTSLVPFPRYNDTLVENRDISILQLYTTPPVSMTYPTLCAIFTLLISVDMALSFLSPIACVIFFLYRFFFAPISAKCVASIMPMTHVPEIGAENRYQTSSSAVAKKPRDASCLSVVSFNSTKRRLESFIVSYVGYRFIIAYS